MTEAPEAILSERNYLWERCERLYNAISQNGTMTSAMFRQAVGIAGNIFKDRGVNIQHSTTWFSALAEFMEMVETARSQKVGPK